MTSYEAPQDQEIVSDSSEPIAGFELLQKLVDLPISTWRYNSEEPGIRHLGPMAQDFMAAYGLGDSDKVIYTVDADGVAFVAIQALSRKIDALEQRLAELDGK